MRFRAILGVIVAAGLSSVATAQDAPRDPQRREDRPGVEVTVSPQEARPDRGAYLGVATSPLAEALRRQLKIFTGTGLCIEFVEPGSPAAVAGLKQYDVLTKLDDQILIDPHQLAVLVRMHKPGDTILMTVIRAGESQTLKAALIEHDLAPLDGIAGGDREIFDDFVQPGPDPAAAAPRRDARALRGQQGSLFRFHPGTGGWTTTSWSDGEHTLTLTSAPDAKQKKLVATDRSGAVLFSGPIDTPEQRAKIPATVADLLKKLEAATTPPAPAEKKDDAATQNDQTPDGAGDVDIQIKS